MKTKKLLAPVLVFVMVMAMAVLSGCNEQQQAENKDVILATTTSTKDSKLLDALIPVFEQESGYKVKTIAVGTGQALEMGKKGEADVLLVHSPKDERELVDSGVGVNYQLVMHNDFVILGPADDPAGIKGSGTIDSFKKIAETESIFVSRGDESGTHKKEKEVWSEAGIQPAGSWYQQSGTGMGGTLNIANEKQGYTLSDRATYLTQKTNLKLEILSEGDLSLLNIYHVMQVSKQKFDKVNEQGAKAFVDFMIKPETQSLIGEFGKDLYNEPLFFPDAGKNEEDLGK